MTEAERKEIVEKAREIHASDEVVIREDAKARPGWDDGYFVEAWVWVPEWRK